MGWLQLFFAGRGLETFCTVVAAVDPVERRRSACELCVWVFKQVFMFCCASYEEGLLSCFFEQCVVFAKYQTCLKLQCINRELTSKI